MPRKTRKSAPRTVPREDEILRYALDVLKHGGLRALTMKRVATRVGFTETAAYRYFPTKEALVISLMKRLRAMFLGAVESIATDESVPPVERLERIVRHHVGFILKTDGLPILFLAEAAANCDRRRLGFVREMLDEYLGVLETLLAKVSRPDDPVRPREKALALFGIAAATAVRLRAGVTPKALERVSRDLVPFVVGSMAR